MTSPQFYEAVETNKPIVETFRIIKKVDTFTAMNEDNTQQKEEQSLFIQAECDYLIPDLNGNTSVIIQHLRSGGVGGIDINLGDRFIAQYEQEQLNELKQYCQKLGIKYYEYPDASETPIEREIES